MTDATTATKAQQEMDEKYVVFVPQVGTGGFKPFFFDLHAIAKLFANETGGTLFEQLSQE